MLAFSEEKVYNKIVYLYNYGKGQNMAKKLTRSQARCEAFKLIFELEQHIDELDFLFDNLVEELPEAITAMQYISGVVSGVAERYEELCGTIEENLKTGWTISRISKVSKAILLLAIYEIKYVADVPEKVAVNEAVELAKAFDEPTSASFVNGVLAGVLKK